MIQKIDVRNRRKEQANYSSLSLPSLLSSDLLRASCKEMEGRNHTTTK